MLTPLRQRLAGPDITRQLQMLAVGAPASAPLSLTLELGHHAPDWLAALPTSAPFWYQARPAQGRFQLGIGHALHVASAGPNRFAALDNAFAGLASHWRHNGTPRAFCGFAFDDGNQTPLPNALLALPAILLESRNGRSLVTLSTPAGKIAQAPAAWQRLLAPPKREPAGPWLPAADRTLAERAWIARVHAALRAIAEQRLDKIVLTRKLSLQAAGPIPVAHLLANLLDQQPASLIYAHGNGASVFLGATPERLVRLHAGQIEADALAGTAWPGSPTLDAPKNRHEQSLVVAAIVGALQKCCDSPLQTSPTTICEAGEVRHLRTLVSGRAAEGITLFDLLRALHPTPAVGGFPSAAALDWLAAHGERRSGWYSGGFGSLTPDGDGAFSVALRSALIEGSRLELQAGAGIVASSDPAQELAETEAKFGTLLAALAPPPNTERSRIG
jgi:isochorismate synthase